MSFDGTMIGINLNQIRLSKTNKNVWKPINTQTSSKFYPQAWLSLLKEMKNRKGNQNFFQNKRQAEKHKKTNNKSKDKWTLHLMDKLNPTFSKMIFRDQKLSSAKEKSKFIEQKVDRTLPIKYI